MQKDIHTAICDSYGSFEVPRLSGLHKKYRNQPYLSLVQELGEFGEVQETTDLNDDVAVVLSISSPGSTFGIRLSLIGPFAVVSAAEGVLLNYFKYSGLSWAQPLLELLTSHGVHVIRREELVERVPFGESEVSLYEILFSSDEVDLL
ncbi:MAG: hypothetical protein GY930_03580 [bacterium]|nr:hypothetical protein [bacterium]